MFINEQICKERRKGYFVVSCQLRVAIPFPKYILFPSTFILGLAAIKTDQVAGLFCMDKMTVFLQPGR